MNEEIVVIEASEKESKEKKKVSIRGKNIHEVNAKNDISFTPPLSYRHFRVFAWICLALAGLGQLFLIGGRMNVTLATNTAGLANFLHGASSLVTPLFLIASFSVILTAKNGYKRLIIMYTGLSILFYLLFILIHQYYIVGMLKALGLDYDMANAMTNLVLAVFLKNGYLAFNIFIDLLLCVLVTFFLNYTPSKHFQGKKIAIFRAFVALPIIYELGSLALKFLASGSVIELSPFVFPLLTTKPPLAFFVFIALAIFMGNRRRHFIKKGLNDKQYKEFLDTNVNKLHFSIFLSSSIFVAAILDFILALFLTIFIASGMGEAVEGEEQIASALSVVNSYGIGNCIPMILLIPVVMLFDYRKQYKNNLPDIIIPVAGIALLLITYIEGGFEIIRFALEDNRRRKAEQSTDSEDILELGKQLITFIKNKVQR